MFAPKSLKIDMYPEMVHIPGAMTLGVSPTGVKITHLPTGIVSICTAERSQGSNKVKALKSLESLYVWNYLEHIISTYSSERTHQT